MTYVRDTLRSTLDACSLADFRGLMLVYYYLALISEQTVEEFALDTCARVRLEYRSNGGSRRLIVKFVINRCDFFYTFFKPPLWIFLEKIRHLTM